MSIKINNMPDYAWAYKFIVFRLVNGSRWFFGAYNSISQALCAYNECGGYGNCEIEETENIEKEEV